MIWIVVALIAFSAALLVLGVAGLVTDSEARLVRRRVQAVPAAGGGFRERRERLGRRRRRESMEAFLEAFGERVGKEQGRRKKVREMLIHAGFRRPNAPFIFVGLRATGAVVFFFAGTFLAAFFGVTAQQRLLMVFGGMLFGWMLPYLIVRRKVRQRQDEVQRTLPDALDLMVVCVEAGLGLNQAMVRVGDEMERISKTLGEELTLVSLEIRAGTPRAEALRNLGYRTGVSDVRGLTSMLIQTDRFGTSVADALRIHADELRTKRRQRAEEAAAKLTVKMVIPIVLFIFPSIFLVILGPAVFHAQELFNMGGG